MIAPPANCWTALITSANTRTPNILNFNPPWIVSPGAPTIVWLPLPRMMFAAVWKASPVTESVTRPPPNSCKLVPVRKPGATSVPPGSMIPPAKPLSRVGSVVTPAFRRKVPPFLRTYPIHHEPLGHPTQRRGYAQRRTCRLGMCADFLIATFERAGFSPAPATPLRLEEQTGAVQRGQVGRRDPNHGHRRAVG